MSSHITPPRLRSPRQTFYVKENGVDLAAINAIEAIVACLRNEDGYCTTPPEQSPSLRTLGF